MIIITNNSFLITSSMLLFDKSRIVAFVEFFLSFVVSAAIPAAQSAKSSREVICLNFCRAAVCATVSCLAELMLGHSEGS